jgi:hypothetical protein
MGVGQEGGGGGLIFGALSLFSQPKFCTFLHRKIGNNISFFKKFFQRMVN